MFNKMIVTVKDYSDNCISLQLFDAEKRRSPSFLILKDLIKDDLLPFGYAADTDINNTIRMALTNNDLVACRAFFISIDEKNHISGYLRCFDVPLAAFEAALNGGSAKCLVDLNAVEHSAKIRLTENAHKAVALMNPQKRRAFVKVLTQYFDYEANVVICKDFGDDFFFSEESLRTDFSLHGGICLSKDEYRGHVRYAYSKHT